MDKKSAAYILFREGYKQGDIAKLLGVSEQAISRWKKNTEWEKKAAADLMVQETIQDDITQLVLYQLSALKKIRDEKEKSGDGPILISKGEIDGVRDLYNMIKPKETDFAQYVRFVRLLTEYLKNNTPELARQVAPFLNEFLNEVRGGNIS